MPYLVYHAIQIIAGTQIIIICDTNYYFLKFSIETPTYWRQNTYSQTWLNVRARQFILVHSLHWLLLGLAMNIEIQWLKE